MDEVLAGAKLPKALYELLQRRAAEEGVTSSDIIRRALRRELATSLELHQRVDQLAFLVVPPELEKICNYLQGLEPTRTAFVVASNALKFLESWASVLKVDSKFTVDGREMNLYEFYKERIQGFIGKFEREITH